MSEKNIDEVYSLSTLSETVFHAAKNFVAVDLEVVGNTCIVSFMSNKWMHKKQIARGCSAGLADPFDPRENCAKAGHEGGDKHVRGWSMPVA